MEDSATGTPAAALSTLLHHFGVFSDQQDLNLTYEQGYAIDTPAELYVRLEQTDGNITAVWVRGFAYSSHESLTAFYRHDVPSYARREHGTTRINDLCLSCGCAR